MIYLHNPILIILCGHSLGKCFYKIILFLNCRMNNAFYINFKGQEILLKRLLNFIFSDFIIIFSFYQMFFDFKWHIENCLASVYLSFNKVNNYYHLMYFSFFLIGREPTTWPVNNFQQISVWLQVIFCLCISETTLLCETGRLVPQAVRGWFDICCWSREQGLNDKTRIIELGYHKYGDLSVSCTNHNISLNRAQ